MEGGIWKSECGSGNEPIADFGLKGRRDDLKKYFLKEEKQNGSNKRKSKNNEWDKHSTVV